MQYNAVSLHSDIDANPQNSKSHQDLVANSFRPQRIPARNYAAIDFSRQDIHAYKVASSPNSSQLTGSAWSPAESATRASFPTPSSGFWASKAVSGDSQSVTGKKLWPAKIEHLLNTSDIVSDDDCVKVNPEPPLIPSGPRDTRRLSSVPPIDLNIPLDGNEVADQAFMISLATNGHDTIRRTQQTSTRGVVWSERQHAHSLRRALKDPAAEWVESYNGAMKILSALNPENYQMPLGSCVINMKTEFSDNILLSIRCGKYSLQQKVSERIMEVWKAREDPSEKVLCIFSVNGSKKYSGVAELSGPWDPQMTIDGWENSATGAHCSGGFPITWVFVKDINFHQFLHIHLAKSGNTVANMWNGMNFATEVGRSVMETYVKTPATSSILGYPRNYQENEHLVAERGSSQRRPSRGARGPRSVVRAGRPEASNLKQMLSRLDQASSHTVHETGMSRSRPALTIDTATPPPRFQFPMPRIAREMVSSSPFQNRLAEDGLRNSAEIDKVPSGMWAARPSKPVISYPMLPRSSTEPALKVDAFLDRGATSRLNSHRQSRVQDSYTFAPPPQTPSPRTHHVALQESPHLCNDHDHQHDRGHDDDLGFGDLRRRGPILLSPVRTPTHVPIHRAGRPGSFIVSHSPTPRTATNARQKEAQLNSRLHLLLADRFAVNGRLADDRVERHVQEQLIVKGAHLLHSIHEIEQELARLTLQGLDISSIAPARSGSNLSSNGVASSSVEMYDVSPVYAADGRPLRSASKQCSPQLPVQHASQPPIFRRKHGFTASWDQRIASDIAKLVAGAEDDNLNVGLGLRLREQAGWYHDQAARPRADSSLEMYQDTTDNGGISIGLGYSSPKRWHG